MGIRSGKSGYPPCGGCGNGLNPSERISVVADAPDNRILECAVAGNADMVVTGDRHLLDLKMYEGIDIVTLSVFLERT